MLDLKALNRRFSDLVPLALNQTAKSIIQYFALLMRVGLVLLAGLVLITGGLPIIEKGVVAEGVFRSVSRPFDLMPVPAMATDAARGILGVIVAGFAGSLVLPAISGVVLMIYTYGWAVVVTVWGVMGWVVRDLPQGVLTAWKTLKRDLSPHIENTVRPLMTNAVRDLRADFPRAIAWASSAVDRTARLTDKLYRRLGQPSIPHIAQLWTKAVDAIHGPLPPHLAKRPEAPAAKWKSKGAAAEPRLP